MSWLCFFTNLLIDMMDVFREEVFGEFAIVTDIGGTFLAMIISFYSRPWPILLFTFIDFLDGIYGVFISTILAASLSLSTIISSVEASEDTDALLTSFLFKFLNFFLLSIIFYEIFFECLNYSSLCLLFFFIDLID